MTAQVGGAAPGSPPAVARVSLQGRYAGFASRFVAFGVGLAFVVWEFFYFAYSWSASGKTAGMAVFGVRVVRPDGTDASGRQAVVRTLALPLSFLLLGLGFLGIVLGDKRRALHDVIAGTAVVYSWDARAARLRFLSRN